MVSELQAVSKRQAVAFVQDRCVSAALGRDVFCRGWLSKL